MSSTAITIIGSGNVATHLAMALYGCGCDIRQVYSRNLKRAEHLAAKVAALPVDDISLVDNKSSLYIIAVADNAIADMAAQLRRQVDDKVVVHTSGSTPLSVLSQHFDNCAVAWPVQTLVASTSVDYANLPFAIEGSNSAAVSAVEQTLRLFTTKIYFLDSDRRRWAHLVATMVSNFGNAINAIAKGLADQQDIDFAMFRPLVAATASKSLHTDLWEQQTGPARRHDQVTLDAHRQMLADQPSLQQLYDLLTNIIQSRC